MKTWRVRVELVNGMKVTLRYKAESHKKAADIDMMQWQVNKWWREQTGRTDSPSMSIYGVKKLISIRSQKPE